MKSLTHVVYDEYDAEHLADLLESMDLELPKGFDEGKMQCGMDYFQTEEGIKLRFTFSGKNPVTYNKDIGDKQYRDQVVEKTVAEVPQGLYGIW